MRAKDNLFEEAYWSTRYRNEETGWDLGEVSPPIAHFFETRDYSKSAILVPGCGNGHEVMHLFLAGHKYVHGLDLSTKPLNYLQSIGIPSNHLFHEDYFDHKGEYDVIVEQTFFCAIAPSLRKQYVQKTASLLKPNGIVVGLLWKQKMQDDEPPFGGDAAEYEALFSPLFDIKTMETSKNSVAPRMGRELFIEFQKKN